MRLGKGLIWKLTDEGLPIYDRKLTAAEVQGRIERCWHPYHAAVAQAISDAHARHGYSIHLNCHSMPAVASTYATDFPGLVHADFVIGDRDGSTAAPALSALVCEVLRGFGYDVSHNLCDSAGSAVLPSRSPITKSACARPGKSVAWLAAMAGIEWQLMWML